MEATRIRLAEGVHLTYLPARKFKTSLLSAQFVTPLRRETAGANALLAAVLRRGTVSCPDMGALSAKMDNLYDASIDYTVRKKAKTSAWALWPALLTIGTLPTANGCWNRRRRCWAS